MKKIKLCLFVLILTTYSSISFGQTATKADSVEFCGKHFIAPKDCETIGNMIKCSDYVFTWTYEPVSDLPRHQKELLAQIEKPKEQNVSVLNTDLIGYLSKVDTFDSLLIIGKVNGKGVIISLFVNKAIKSTADLPEFTRQLITIK
ncbi:hypothetical protein NF867_09885 [Solitalea sp. MAHUQ-68]|uniref:DUF4252 domain-containing protein n=1 Tax=Solitalea agri TaxID=2953739 RepID=A0A9X2F1X6_9SPHI|nr:hypothetical protein [Solitalea agri]MCO4293174.1 hypothetical protein [Solitalea agri]